MSARMIIAGLKARLTESQAEVAALKSGEREEKVRELAVRAVRAEAEVARLRAALVVDVYPAADESAFPDGPEFERECAYRQGWNDCAAMVGRAALEPTR